MSDMFEKFEKLKKTKEAEKKHFGTKKCERCEKIFPIDELNSYRKKNYCMNCLEITKKEESEKRKQKYLQKEVKKQKKIPEGYDELIKIQKEQTRLLKKIASTLEIKSAVNQELNVDKIKKLIEDNLNSIKVKKPTLKRVDNIEEIKNLIEKFIRGQLPNDRLPTGRDHRTFRIGNFVKRMMEEWNIIIEREHVERAKEEMEKDNIILPTGAAGKNFRYVLKEYIEKYARKISKKDEEILNWLKNRDSFLNKDFTARFYPKKNPKRPSDLDWSSANKKIKVLIKRNWINPIQDSRPKEFKVQKEIIQHVFN
ncbi:MAG: hypothetical protein ACTSVY_08415 [Candidatus Helarchaeota archaeon]